MASEPRSRSRDAVGTKGSPDRSRGSLSTRFGFIAVACCLATAAGVAEANGGNLRLRSVDAFGIWSLARLGQEDFAFPMQSGKRQAGVVARYLLPNGASQGPDNWFLIRLRFRLTLASDTGTGRVYVSAATGRPADPRTSAQIRFDVLRSGADLQVRSDSLGLVTGNVVKTSTAFSQDVSFSNYIPYAGVRPGVNALRVQLEQYGAARVAALTIFKESGIEYSRAAPQNLKLVPSLSTRRVSVGETVRVNVRIVNGGERRSQDGKVMVLYPRSSFRDEPSDVTSVPPLTGGSSWSTTFRLTARESGRHPITVQGLSALDHPNATLWIDVTRPSAPSSRAVILLPIVLVPVAFAGLWLMTRQLRR